MLSPRQREYLLRDNALCPPNTVTEALPAAPTAAVQRRCDVPTTPLAVVSMDKSSGQKVMGVYHDNSRGRSGAGYISLPINC